MPFRSLELGISALQAGSTVEGARLIRIALKSGQLSAESCAIGWLWLAEYEPDPAKKRAYYEAAIAADPNNLEARQRLALLESNARIAAPPAVTTEAPAAAPPPTSAVASASSAVNVADHVASIIGGPNGPGTGVFISADGLIATTRFVAGSNERLTIELHTGQQLNGRVLRSYPEVDLAFIQIDFQLNGLLPITPLPRVPDDSTLIALSYSGEMQQGAQRVTQRALAPHWIPTTFTRLYDAGGALLFDDRNYLVGIMTRNTARTSAYFFGLHILMIHRLRDAYLAEAQTMRGVYCPACGSYSRAGGAGFFFCETCGAVVPNARHLQRYPTPQAEAYYDVGRARCARCGATAGFHAGRCLRCGRAQENRPLA
ncbi:MAG: serine protease [Aggregatilineales bacterium]